MGGPSRRLFLGGLAGTVGGMALARAGRPADAVERQMIVRSARPQNLETALLALDAELTPNELFFVRSHFGPAILDAKQFRLELSGMVARPLSLSLHELRALPKVKLPAVLQCAGNGRGYQRPQVPGAQWLRGAVGQAEWTGVRLGDLLERAEVKAEARFVTFAGGDPPPMPTVPRFRRSIPVAKALHPATLVAYEMNGVPLSVNHGAPLRAVVPGWYGDHWVKWLREIYVDAEEDAGFYMKKGYRTPEPPTKPGETPKPEQMKVVTAMVVKSLITRPGLEARLKAAPTTIAGLAFAGEHAVRAVEVSVDGGTSWQPARLAASKGLGAWQRWELPWRPAPGRYRLLARATDELGATQPERGVWNPSGYQWNGWDQVECEVLS